MSSPPSKPFVRYIVGQYGEWSSAGPILGVESPGYPVHRVAPDAPELKHAVAWFVYEHHAIQFAKILNKADKLDWRFFSEIC